MGSVLNLLKLTDGYERKARLLPALLSCMVFVPMVAVFGSGIVGWVTRLSIGGGVAVVGAVGLAYAASGAGRHYEKRLWPRWPYDAPTNRWLHPDYSDCSQEQKQIWYDAVKQLAGLDISRAVGQGDPDNLERVINDAVRALRHQFRLTKVDGLLVTHNEDYGFARNLTGLRLIWSPGAFTSCIVAWAGYIVTGNGLTWGIVASVVLALSIVLLCVLPAYVRQRADRYADSFFGTLTALSKDSRRQP